MHKSVFQSLVLLEESDMSVPGRLVELAQEIKAFIRDGNPALIRVNGAEWEVFCCSLALRQHIEES